MENLFYSNAKEKDYKHVQVASDPEVYSINKYFEHVLVQVRNAITVFKDKFFEKHSGANLLLTREMIAVTFLTFKCNLPLKSKEDVDDHFEDVHGIEGGATDLLPSQEIEVNASIPFEVPDLATIENVGQDKKSEIIRAFYITCVSRGVINKTNNRNKASLSESRSKEFMKELSKSSSTVFFGRFRKYLKEKSNKGIDESFLCKWKIIEEALYSAVGREQNVTRLYNFVDKDGSDFNPYPMELLIDQVENHVNAVEGKDTTAYTDSKHRTVSVYSVYKMEVFPNHADCKA